MKKQVNHIALIIDESGSMKNLRSKVIEAINERIGKIRQEALDNDQETYVSLIKFADFSSVIYWDVPSDNIQPITYNEYYPNHGLTALLDSVGQTIQKYRNEPHKNNESWLIMAITDGKENKSQSFSPYGLKK